VTANDNSTLDLTGTGATTLSSAAALDLFDLRVNTPAGTTTDATFNVRGTLQLDDGDFDVSSGTLALVSDITRTGRLGPVAAGASYTGDLRMERFVPAGVTNWRLLSSPVGGVTVQEWDADFLTAGFPGSDFPGFTNPVGSSTLWPSIRVYDETDTGAGLTDGLVGVGNVTDALTAGVGFAAWCGDNLVSTTAFTIDVTGPHTIAS
ncbi:MAG: hypothetical protein KDB96_19540, partial [Flavobacteriales bacterium]|nr:hypothetical protein [Flavobacteriales bacterium]